MKVAQKEEKLRTDGTAGARVSVDAVTQDNHSIPLHKRKEERERSLKLKKACVSHQMTSFKSDHELKAT